MSDEIKARMKALVEEDVLLNKQADELQKRIQLDQQSLNAIAERRAQLKGGHDELERLLGEKAPAIAPADVSDNGQEAST